MDRYTKAGVDGRLVALEDCWRLWKWMAGTGKEKYDWPEWRRLGRMRHDCPCCEYAEDGCQRCPLLMYWPVHCQNGESLYLGWFVAKGRKEMRSAAWQMQLMIEHALVSHIGTGGCDAG